MVGAPDGPDGIVSPWMLERRNCCRCGSEFTAVGRRRRCLRCRAYRAHPKVHSTLPTVRQGQILSLLREGGSNKEIAAKLHLSEGTVKQYLSIMFRRWGVANRTALACTEVVK
jgi:DNA-binding NarL/FixJ family response regulator